MAIHAPSIEAALADARERDPIAFVCEGEETSFRARSFTLREGASELYEAKVLVESALPTELLADKLLGRVARLSFGDDDGGRTVHGIVRAVETRGVATTTAGSPTFVEITICPKLALSAHRKTSRIFQDVSVVEVIDRILDEWSIPRRWALSQAPTSWPYNVQHQESDLDFIRRVLAAEGIFFFFEDSGRAADSDVGDGVRVVFGDSSAAYASLDGRTGRIEPALVFAPRNQPTSANEDRLFRFGERQQLREATVLLRDHSGLNANADLALGATATRGPRADTMPLSKLRSSYEFMPSRPLDASARTASTALEQLRRDARVFVGESRAPRLRAGFLFTVSRHDDSSLDGTYLVTSLLTLGCDPRFLADGQGPEESLRQEVEAVRSNDVFRPARTHRAHHQGFDTAVVVGPSDAPVICDALGRVRVRFHWDEERPGIDEDPRQWSDRSTWLRVTQPWSGSGHGAFFLPRVGDEVLVGYVGGDINRPIIVGSLPNSAQPPPFSLPADMGKSGIVSRGLSGAGHSELVFDDTGGRESARLASQRKLELCAEQDLETRAGRNESVVVAERSHLVVGQERRESIAGERVVSVQGKATFEAANDVAIEVAGNTRLSLASTDVRFREDTTVTADAPLVCRSMSDLRVEVDGIASLRHRDTLFVSVGGPERQASHLLHVEGASTHEAKGILELSSEQEIVLRSGDSSIHISPKAIQIRTPKVRIDADSIELVGSAIHLEASKLARIDAPKVFALSDGASLSLTTMAKLNGSMVKLGAPPDASDGPEAKKDPAPPTTIKLVDQDGKPIAGERCLVRLTDGTTRAAVTDQEGIARIHDLSGSAKLDFVDLSNWEKS